MLASTKGNFMRHPGQFLNDYWIKPFRFSHKELAFYMKLEEGDIADFVAGKYAITEYMIAVFTILFETDPDMWRQIQYKHDRGVIEPMDDIDLSWLPFIRRVPLASRV